ncbi:MAG: ABC transporter permease [Candidatus Xenobia bacterium]
MLLRKALTALATVLVAMSFTFVLLRSMPGDMLHMWAVQIQQQQGISYQEARQIARTMLNYDPTEPLGTQYLHYMANLLRGDLGYSLTYRIPVTTILLNALPWTVFVATTSVMLSFVVGCLLGVTVAWRRKSLLDPLITLYASVTQAVPDFLIALLLLLIFGLALHWLPMRGAYGPDVEPGWSLSFLLDALYHAVLPVMAFTLPGIGGWVLAMKASAMSALGEDYINVARAKGLREYRILTQYLGRNAMLPLVTGLASALGGTLGGSMLVESVFGYPGVGRFLAEAIALRDYTLMQGLFLLVTVGIVVGNLLGDVLVTRLDPRVRLQ